MTLNGKIKFYLEITSLYSLIVWRLQLEVCLVWKIVQEYDSVLKPVYKALRPK